MTDLLTFQRWPDPPIDRYDNPPDLPPSHRSPAPPSGRYDTPPDGAVSRICWLPIIGPTSWLVWGTLATQLRHEPTVTWEPANLAEAHGIARSISHNGPMRRTL